MTFKLTQQAQGKWRRINAPNLVQELANGVTFVDGVKIKSEEAAMSTEAAMPTKDNQSNSEGENSTKDKAAA
jgi:hypothetical protein